MRRVDPNMHDRVVEELWKLGDTNVIIAEKLGCNYQTVTQWLNQTYIPSAYHFANFHRAGMDIIYILTGERNQ